MGIRREVPRVAGGEREEEGLEEGEGAGGCSSFPHRFRKCLGSHAG